MSARSVYTTLAAYEGFCAGCCGDEDYAPLVITEHGPRGLRAWLSGVGPEDRELAYTCVTCGRIEHVPQTQAEDDEYAATLPLWTDWSPVEPPAAVASLSPFVVAAGDVFALAAARVRADALVMTLPTQRRPIIRVVTLPVQRVEATDDHLLALSA